MTVIGEWSDRTTEHNTYETTSNRAGIESYCNHTVIIDTYLEVE